MAILRRSDYSERLFPPPAQDVKSIDTNQYAAAVLMTTGDAQNLSFLNRIAGLRLNRTQWLMQLLHLRRQAMAAEAEGRQETADFFFREIMLKLKRAPEPHAMWSDLVQNIAAGGGKQSVTASKLYRATINELFVDVHCALYNAYSARSAEPSVDSRQFAHLAHIKNLLILSCAPEETQRELIGPGLRDQAIAALRQGSLRACSDSVEELLKRFPADREYSETGATILFECALKALSNAKDDGSARADAARLDGSTRRMDRFCQERPDCGHAFALAGRLHHVRAVKLANGDLVAEALVEIEQAVAYCPEWEEAKQARAQIEELLKALTTKPRS